MAQTDGLARVVRARAALIPFLGRRFTVVGKPSQASEIENRRSLAVDFEKTLVGQALEGAGDVDLGQAEGVGDVLLAPMEGEGAAPPPRRTGTGRLLRSPIHQYSVPHG